jgi:hypothetical protein
MLELFLIIAFIAPSWIFALLYYRFGILKTLKSPQLVVLNGNLAKIDLYWSTSDGTFKVLSEAAVEADRAHMVKTFFMMTAFMSLLSVLGMFLLILIFVSGRPRLERNTFESSLVRNGDLNATDVQLQVDELKSLI